MFSNVLSLAVITAITVGLFFSCTFCTGNHQIVRVIAETITYLQTGYFYVVMVFSLDNTIMGTMELNNTYNGHVRYLE